MGERLNRIRRRFEPLLRRVFHAYFLVVRGMTLGVRAVVLDAERNPALAGVAEMAEIREVETDYETKAADGRRVYYVVLGVPSACKEAVEEALAADLGRPDDKPTRKR